VARLEVWSPVASADLRRSDDPVSLSRPSGTPPFEQNLRPDPLGRLQRFIPISVSPASDAIVLDKASTYPVGAVTPFPPSMLQAAAPTVSDFGAPLSEVGFYLVHGPHGFYAVPMTAQRQADEKTCRGGPSGKTEGV
jgi:hypothetical protein